MIGLGKVELEAGDSFGQLLLAALELGGAGFRLLERGTECRHPRPSLCHLHLELEHPRRRRAPLLAGFLEGDRELFNPPCQLIRTRRRRRFGFPVSLRGRAPLSLELARPGRKARQFDLHLGGRAPGLEHQGVQRDRVRLGFRGPRLGLGDDLSMLADSQLELLRQRLRQHLFGVHSLVQPGGSFVGLGHLDG